MWDSACTRTTLSGDFCAALIFPISEDVVCPTIPGQWPGFGVLSNSSLDVPTPSGALELIILTVSLVAKHMASSNQNIKSRKPIGYYQQLDEATRIAPTWQQRVVSGLISLVCSHDPVVCHYLLEKIVAVVGIRGMHFAALQVTPCLLRDGKILIWTWAYPPACFRCSLHR